MKQALAYTKGSNVYIAPGQERHLPHELGHVVQQKKRIVPATMRLNGAWINDNPVLERQADASGNETVCTSSEAVATKAEASLDPLAPLHGTEVGSKTGIYCDYDLVQGHLMNAALGGRAIDCNLFPLTIEASQQPRSKLTGHQTCSAAEQNTSAMYRLLTLAAFAKWMLRIRLTHCSRE